MTFKQAQKLHNGDEVIDKNTKESVRVLSIFVENIVPGVVGVMIEGIGSKQGHNYWQHTTVK